jgi:hypothetical protein
MLSERGWEVPREDWVERKRDHCSAIQINTVTHTVTTCMQVAGRGMSMRRAPCQSSPSPCGLGLPVVH